MSKSILYLVSRAVGTNLAFVLIRPVLAEPCSMEVAFWGTAE
jgi:hypothetical protein